MDDRLTKIITRKGDDGSTSLDGKIRIVKNDLRLEVIGELDELNSSIGVVLSSLNNKNSIMISQALLKIQNNLFNAGGELCIIGSLIITNECTIYIETIAKQLNKKLPPLKEFVLPGGGQSAAYCHLARAVCRRCERRLVELSQHAKINPELLKYINRLSDFLFIVARYLNFIEEEAEILWSQG